MCSGANWVVRENHIAECSEVHLVKENACYSILETQKIGDVLHFKVGRLVEGRVIAEALLIGVSDIPVTCLCWSRAGIIAYALGEQSQ